MTDNQQGEENTSFGKMDAMKAEICLMCYNSADKSFVVPLDDSTHRIFRNCLTYLHSSVTTDLPVTKSSQMGSKNYLPFCKNCISSAWELNQLAENLVNLQTQISDLSVAFSLAVFYRRSQVEDGKRQNRDTTNFGGTSVQQRIELNVSCLPPNIFSSHTSEHQTTSQSLNTEHSETNKYQAVSTSQNTADMGYLNRNPSKYLHSNSFAPDSIQTQRADFFPYLYGIGEPRRENNPNTSHSVVTANENNLLCEKETILQHKVIEDNNTARTNSEKQNSERGYSNPSECWKRKQSDSESDSSCDTRTSIRTFSPNTEEMRPPVPMFGAGAANSYNKHTIPKEEGDYEEKPFSCSFCRKRFKVSTDAKIHERIHTGAKPYKCFYCEKSFAQISHRTVHQRIHTGEKPYKCSYCEKTFSQSCNKKIHEERNHTREAPI